MSARAVTLEQIRLAGLEALARELGPVGMVRFLQQFEGGSGDYTREREQWVGQYSVEELAEEIRRRRTQTRDPGRADVGRGGREP